MKWWHSNWRRPEIFGSVIGLLGVMLGGVISYEATTQAQNRTDQRMAAAGAASARGIARVLEAHYADAAVTIHAMEHRGEYFIEPPLTDTLPYDDRKRLAASVSAETWIAVTTADADLASLVEAIDAMAPYDQRYMSDSGRRDLDATRHDLMRARLALAKTTG